MVSRVQTPSASDELCFFSSQVGESSLQTGNLYSPYMKACRNLYLGSSQAEQGSSFRGLIGGLVLWDYERSHMELLKGPLQTDPSLPVLAMWADFLKVSPGFRLNLQKHLLPFGANKKKTVSCGGEVILFSFLSWSSRWIRFGLQRKLASTQLLSPLLSLKLRLFPRTCPRPVA